MSLGGMTTIALADHAPDLVRKVVLVDVTPGVNERKSSTIAEFINGPESFDSFDDLLARTIEYNPTRTEASLRRGILHNAEQREDGSWVWRYQRFRAFEPALAESAASETATPTSSTSGTRCRASRCRCCSRAACASSRWSTTTTRSSSSAACRTRRSSTSRRPATASRATPRSSSPRASSSFVFG